MLMNKKIILLAIFLSGISMLAGMYYPQLKDEFRQWRNIQQNIGSQVIIPEKGVRSSSISINMFQEALERNEGKSNIFLAPFLTYSILEELVYLSEGKTRKQIEKHLIPQSEDIIPYTIPRYTVLPTTDFGLPLPSKNVTTLRLPFKDNKPQTLSTYNSLLANHLNIPRLQLLTSENTSEFTRFIIGAVCHFHPNWQIPFAESNTTRVDFYNADGAIRRVDMMRCRGLIRTAKAEDASWEAVALFFSPNQEGNTPTAFIAIMPANGIKETASSLSVDMLNDIRTRLAKATPQDCRVDLPRIICESPTIDLHQQLEKWGLDCLFNAAKADFSPVSTQKIALDNIFAKYNLVLTENTKKAGTIPEQAAHEIVFDKPFIWLIGDLTSELPPFYMGVLMNL